MLSFAYRGFLAVSCIVVFGVGLSAAQGLYQVETRPVRGFMPNMDQLSSPVDHIDPVSGKIHLEIPLASLPRGRAGSGFDLNLVYDTHIWNLTPERYEAPNPGYDVVFGHQLEFNWGDRSGWNLNVDNVGLDYEEHIPESPYWPQCTDPYVRQYRLRIRLLDGSSHVLHLKGHEDGTDLSQQGFYQMNPGGRAQCFQFETPSYSQFQTGWLTYYTVDGSYLKLEIFADGSGNWHQQPWYLYFPDGRRIVGNGLAGSYSLYDANNNRVQVSNACNSGCLHWGQAIFDDSGHEIVVTETGDFWSGNITTTVTTTGPNGPMAWTLNWELNQLGADGRRYVKAVANQWWPNPPDVTWPLSRYMTRLKYIQLPLAAPVSGTPPPIWNSYAFGYSDDDDDGFGEVDMVRTPTGATFQYQYGNEGIQNHLAELIAHDNKVTERRVSQPGQPDLVWTYLNGLVTNPDSTQTIYWVGPSGAYLDASIPNLYGAGSVVYRIDEPNGTVRKRVWSVNRGVLPWMGNVWVKSETVTMGNAAGVPTLTTVTDKVIDKNGNTLQTVEYDTVPFSASGPEVGVTPLRTTQFQYYAEVPAYTTLNFNDPETYASVHFSPLAPTQPRRLNAVRRKEVRDGAGNIAAVTEYTYGDPYRSGNLEEEKRWDSVKTGTPPALGQMNASNSQVLTRDYDTYGNLTDIFAPEVRTRITYDAEGNNPTRVDYAYQTADQRSWSYAWHAPSGALTSKTDLDNNLTIAYTYDAVGRPLTVNEAGVRKTETVYDDENRKVTVKKDLVTFGDGKLQAVTEYDELGRSIRTIASEPGNPTGIQTKTTYYPLTNRTVQSSPYRSTSDATLEWTCTQKDGSGRVTAIAMFKGATEPTDCESTSNRTGITRTAYDTNWVQLTDPAGKVRVESRDALGRLVQVIEDPGDPQAGKLNYSTYYSYDSLDNLIQVSQGVQTRTFTYSSLGRLLSATNPESGTINYAYTDGGDLLTRQDARNAVASFTYDHMHRIKTKTYTVDPQVNPLVQATPNVTYNYYTTGAPNIGQLQSVTSSVATTYHDAYDALGRVTASTHIINGYTSPQSFGYTYWLSDGVKSVQYPSGRTVNYDVDDAGRTVKVRDAASTFADLTGIASSAAFTADGRVSALKLGNELWETRDYRTPGTPTKYRVGTTNGGAEMLELEYNFSAAANNGNLLSQVIRNPGRTWSQSYSYDALNRIHCAGEAVSAPADPCTQGDWRQVFGIDRYGNRWVEASVGLTGTDVHEPTVSTNFDPNTNRLYIQGSQYDAAGNQTFYTPFALAYDAENRMVTMTGGASGNGTFTYDGDGRRVKKSWTVGGTTTTTYYFRNALGQLALEYSSELSANPGRIYVHTDMLGSTRLVSSDKPANWPASTASVLECYDYAPFGRMLNSSDPQNSGNQTRNTGCHPPNPDYVISSNLSQKFTGKERDAETKLDFFGARYYSAAQGRFVSSDPKMFADAKYDPQSLNKYAYVRNNPMRLVDPDGRDWWDIVNGIGNAWVSNNLFGAGRIKNGNSDFRTGQILGDQIATIQGTIQMLVGGAGFTGGTALDMTGVGAVVGVPAQAASVAVAGHGATVFVTGGKNLIDGALGTHERRANDFSAAVKRDIDNANATDNSGVNRCENCGKELERIQNKKGIPTPDNQLQRHHKKAAADGGPGTKENSAVLCPPCHKEEHRPTRQH